MTRNAQWSCIAGGNHKRSKQEGRTLQAVSHKCLTAASYGYEKRSKNRIQNKKVESPKRYTKYRTKHWQCATSANAQHPPTRVSDGTECRSRVPCNSNSERATWRRCFLPTKPHIVRKQFPRWCFLLFEIVLDQTKCRLQSTHVRGQFDVSCLHTKSHTTMF